MKWNDRWWWWWGYDEAKCFICYCYVHIHEEDTDREILLSFGKYLFIRRCLILVFIDKMLTSIELQVTIVALNVNWAPGHYCSSQHRLSFRSLVVLNISWAPGHYCSTQRQLSSRSLLWFSTSVELQVTIVVLNVRWAPGHNCTKKGGCGGGGPFLKCLGRNIFWENLKIFRVESPIFHTFSLIQSVCIFVQQVGSAINLHFYEMLCFCKMCLDRKNTFIIFRIYTFYEVENKK